MKGSPGAASLLRAFHLKREFILGLLLMTRAAFGAQDPTFHTGIELVQVSVVAQDHKGKPVADLRREEFQIFDNGSPQEIRLFVPETEKSNPAPPEPKGLNAFTNRIASAGSRSGYSAILIDSPYFGDPTEDGNSLARVQALRMLRSIPMGESIAIYATGRKLRVVCEFTSDRDLLERQLQKWKPGADTPDDDIPVVRHPPGMRGDAAADAARIEALQSIDSGEIDLVADHLAGIPGRKNLLWLSTRFVIGPRAWQKLNAASVAIYPVDVGGVCRVCPPRPTALMDAIAAQTGGVAYYLRNDLDVAMREAMDDGRVSYTLGFYQSGDDRAPQIHQLAVHVSRPGVALRYRTSYQTQGTQPVSAATKADLAKALGRPVNATAIPIKASVTRTQDRLNVQATLDVEGLDLAPNRNRQNENRWTGKIEVVARFTTADGIVAGDVFSQTMTLNLRQTTYDAAVQDGLPYRNIELKVPNKAVELRLLFANLATGKIGTLTIPLSEVE